MSGRSNNPNVQHVPRGSNPTKRNGSKTLSKKKSKVNDKEGEEIKKKSNVVNNRRYYTIAEKARLRGLIDTDIEKAEYDKGPEKNTVVEICEKYGIHWTAYYKWQKTCYLYYDKLRNYTTDGVKCTARHCTSQLCYPCLSRVWFCGLSRAPTVPTVRSPVTNVTSAKERLSYSVIQAPMDLK